MSRAQIEEFLQAPRHAIVGTNRRDGPPQLTPVWYLYEKGKLYTTMFVKSAKYRNLRRDPRIGICIVGDHPDARAVMIYGTVEFWPEHSEAYQDYGWRVTRRYHESDEAARKYKESLASDEESVMVVVTPERILAHDFN
jgi:PPOX class probable F420-dependent enzyme